MKNEDIENFINQITDTVQTIIKVLEIHQDSIEKIEEWINKHD